MASKMSVILSLFFVVLFFVFSSDIINVQFAYSNLDSLSVNVNYILSKENGNSSKVNAYLFKYPNISFRLVTEQIVLGEPAFYTLTQTFNPFVMNGGNLMKIRIERSVVIGFLY